MSNPWDATKGDLSTTSDGGVRNFQLRRFDPFSVGRVLGGVYAALGVLIGVPYALLIGVLGLGAGEGPEGAGMLVGAVCAAIGIPVMYGILGAIFGAISAFIYNVMAGWLGGIEIELAET